MTWLRTAPLAAILAAVTACGGGSTAPPDNGEAAKPVADIIRDSQMAFQQAASIHVVGDFQQGTGRIKLDLQLTRSGDATGTVSPADTPPIDVRKTGNNVYIRTTQEFWRKEAGDAGANIIGERWVFLPPGNPDADKLSQGLADFSISSLAQNVFGSTDLSKVTKGARTQVGGQPALTLADPDGRLYIATTGRPYPLRLEPTGSADRGQFLQFGGYDSPLTVTAPRDFLDIGKLQAAAGAQSP